MRCDDCGCPLFDEPARVVGGRPFCRDCAGRRALGGQRLGVVFAGVVVLGGLAVAALLPLGHDALLARAGLLVIGAYFASTALHEVGHAVAARACGLAVLRLSLGAGQPLWRGTVAGIDVEVCSYPTSGFVEHAPGTRGQSLLVALAGPGTNLALLAAAWALGIGATWPGDVGLEGFGLAHALVGTNLLIAFYNLVPLEVLQGEPGEEQAVVRNDGLAALRALRGQGRRR